MFICLAIYTTCACHLVIFISEESLFVDTIESSVVQTAAFYLNTVWCWDETTITLIVFLKIGQVSESSECKAKPRRAQKLTSLLVTGRFCVCLTQICTGRMSSIAMQGYHTSSFWSTCPLFFIRNAIICEDIQKCQNIPFFTFLILHSY